MSATSTKSNGKKSAKDVQDELRALGRPADGSAPKPPVDLTKAAIRVGAVLVVLWVVGLGLASFMKSQVPVYVLGAVTILVVALGVYAFRTMKKTQALGEILHGAQTAEGREAALKKLETDFKKGDVQATMARAQLEMQTDPKKALESLETIDLGKQLTPVADQVRSMRAMIHLTVGEVAEAKALVDVLELGKQQDAKTRAMFATVAGEAWGRSGNAKKAVETLELFNPDDPEYGEMKVQMWRARAFAYAGNNDMKGASRALKKLSDMSPQLLGMFVGQRKIHPLLEREAKQLLMQSGAMPRKMVRQRV
ncbi:MAG: hypothetical protein U0169_07605 [Polyangiaceae bacterium]